MSRRDAFWSNDCDFANRPKPRATLNSCLDLPSRRLPEWEMQLRLWNTYFSKVRDSPKPFGPKSAGRSSFERGRLGIVFLLDGPHTG
jgi:hypothetical protein